jgi:hypothetical protein
MTYEEVAGETYPKDIIGDAFTLVRDYKTVEPLLSERPLRRPRRNRLESPEEHDRRDVEIARESLQEPGAISLDDIQRELGL